jgi:hypothetical protein
VSAVQSANRSGPVGSTDGQQPFRDGLLVREEQPTVLGFTPLHGQVAISCRATLSGCGVHAFRDPGLVEDFAAPTVAVDVTRTHTYAVTWTADGVDFLLDGALVRSTAQSPGYPMQLILGVFDFPDRATAAQREGREPPPAPELVVERVWGRPPS